MLQSDEARDWETFLGSLAQELDRQTILADIHRATDRPLSKLIGQGPGWRQVQGLLDLLLEDRSYVSGQVW